MDRDFWAERLPHRETVEIGNRCFYLDHNIEDLELDPSDGFDVVVYGHSHIPKIYWKKGVIYFNPGGAGPKRFKLPVSMGRITIKDHLLESRIVNLL